VHYGVYPAFAMLVGLLTWDSVSFAATEETAVYLNQRQR
jgi:hypothetical protein